MKIVKFALSALFIAAAGAAAQAQSTLRIGLAEDRLEDHAPVRTVLGLAGRFRVDRRNVCRQRVEVGGGGRCVRGSLLLGGSRARHRSDKQANGRAGGPQQDRA